EDQKQEVINNGLLKMIVKAMQTNDSDIQHACSWALSNLVEDGSRAQILSLVSEKPMPALSDALRDPYTLKNVLEVIIQLFYNVDPNQLDKIKEEAKDAGVLEHLKNLQGNTDKKVHHLANKILSKYFTESDSKGTNEKLKENEAEKNKKKVQKRKRSVDKEAAVGDSKVANVGFVMKSKEACDEMKKGKK
ncbi:hypothetical protein PMAYCL1PPCAC_26473, partial [Pristionchus mayeri]